MCFKTSFYSLFTFLLIAFTGCVTAPPVPSGDPSASPSVQREFRAAWVATVANINWPSRPGLPVDQQKAEALSLLDLLKEHRFNAVILQVRPQCDALYLSEIEPWSYYLTGEQGRAPEPFYDPLDFWIEEAHRRGLELHAWLNPYRAHHVAGGPVSEASIVKRRPELAVSLERGFWWLDPGLQGTRDHSYAVVMDLVRRYDLDGIHFDDYFYPYPDYNNFKDFPDDGSWQAYVNGGGKLDRSDWRRENVNDFIQRLYRGIKKEKPYVKFGLSPFGIWRPYHPPSVSGFDQHEVLYADARLWLNKGWIDYYSPQLYWPIGQLAQSFPVLLGWWSAENKEGRHLWPGISIDRFKGQRAIDETISQIMITRGMMPDSPGLVHWNIGPIATAPPLARAISQGPYRQQALVPASPWLGKRGPKIPELSTAVRLDSLDLVWSPGDQTGIANWVLYKKYGTSWQYEILGKYSRQAVLPAFEVDRVRLHRAQGQDDQKPGEFLIPLNGIALSAVDRNGNESAIREVPVSFSANAAPDMQTLLSMYPPPSGPAAYPAPAVLPGIEVLLGDYLEKLRGRRIGLIAHPASLDSKLRNSAEILATAAEVDLALLVQPLPVEGDSISRVYRGEFAGVHAAGIPVYNLIRDAAGDQNAWMNSIDLLLLDLQESGAAGDAHHAAAVHALKLCAGAGIPLMVLDRPNPLGGLSVEGPVKATAGGSRSLPIRHGMTIGELALMWNEEDGYGADLTVIPMKGWRRYMMWPDTGLLWAMPGPDLATFESALVFPGQSLLTGSNIFYGSGSAKPFLISGAPWIDAAASASDLNSRGISGAVFRPVSFVYSRTADHTSHRDETENGICGGVEIMITDATAYKSVETSLHLIDAYRNCNPDSLRWSAPPVLRDLFKAGAATDRLMEALRPETDNFMGIRRKYLLYR